MMRVVGITLIVLLLFSGSALAAPRDPVVLVHGFGGGCWNFAVLEARLKADGYRTFCQGYSNPLGPNEPNARQLAAFVDQVLLETGASKVDMVVHSMGGLSSRYYIKNLGGAAKVRDLVTLGSPHHGTYWAYGCYLLTACRQMVPGNSFLKALNNVDETPRPVRYTSIWSVCDEVNDPKTNSIISGARNMKVWWCVGHAGLLVDPWVYGWVKEGLNGKGSN